MTSANGYAIEVQGHTLVATWAAPYFVLVTDNADNPCEPLLIHCENAAHARRQLACGGILLNHAFEAVERRTVLLDSVKRDDAEYQAQQQAAA